MTTETSKPTGELPWLDWLRFAAAFIVVCHHARQMSFVAYGVLPAENQSIEVLLFYTVTRPGAEAVLMFFVLSGYLVGGKLIEKIRGGRFDLTTYAVDRVTRLWVPLVPALVLSVVVALIFGPVPSALDVLGTLVGFQGFVTGGIEVNGPLWTLAYETWFYILAGAMGCLFVGSHRRTALGIVIFSCLLLAPGAEFLLCWILGALVYLWKPRRISIFAVVLSALMIAYAVVQIEFGTGGYMQDPVFWMLRRESAVSMFAGGVALLIPSLLCIQPPTEGWLGRLYRLGTPSAAFSYSLYLTHYPILWAFSASWPAYDVVDRWTFGIYLVRVGACVCFAVAVYWLFERRTGDIRRWVHTRTSRRAQSLSDSH